MENMERQLVTILKGRAAFGGVAEGYALVCPDSITGWGGINDEGVVTEPHHIHLGESIKDRVVLLPGGKGSCGWSCHYTALKVLGNAPAAWVFTHTDSRTGVAVVTMEIPAVCDFESDPFQVIRDGDWLKVDGDKGVVEVWR